MTNLRQMFTIGTMNNNVRQQHAPCRAARVKTVFRFGRIVLGLGLLGLLVVWNGPREICHALLQASLPLLAGALALYLAATVLVAWRWKLVLHARGVEIGLATLVRSYLIAFFFNNFTPSSVGGDIIRIVCPVQHGCPVALSVGSVFVERLVGFLAMTILAIGSMAYLSSVFAGDTLLIVCTATLGGVFLLSTMVCFSHRAARIMTAVFVRLRWRGVGKKIQSAYDAVHAFRAHMSTLWFVFLISLAYQTTMGVFTYWVMHAAGMHAPFLNIFALMQISSMVGVLPITFDGMGVREGIFVNALGAAGFATTAVLPAIIMVRIVSMVGSLVGGLLFLCGGRHTASVEKPA